MDNDLMRLRAQIDQIDQQILDLLSCRLQMAEQVAKAKPNGASVFVRIVKRNFWRAFVL